MPLVDLSADALARLEAQLQADLDAVRRTRALLAQAPAQAVHPAHTAPPVAPQAPVVPQVGAAPAPGPVPVQPAAPSFVYVPPPPLSVGVAKAVALLEGEFTLRQVKDVMSREKLGGHLDTAVRKMLNAMVRRGELEQASASVGRAGSTYRRVVKG